MTKMIGVDFDDVIVSTNEALCLWHNKTYGTSYQKEDIVTYDHLKHIWQCSQEEMHRRINEFFDTDEHRDIIPVPGVIDTLRLFGKENISIVTARPKCAHIPTYLLVEKHLPLLLDKIKFTSDMVNGIERTKAEICQELGVEVFIDDCLDYVLNVSSAGIPVLLFDNPWNQVDTLPHNVERVYSWDEIVKKLQ